MTTWTNHEGLHTSMYGNYKDNEYNILSGYITTGVHGPSNRLPIVNNKFNASQNGDNLILTPPKFTRERTSSEFGVDDNCKCHNQFKDILRKAQHSITDDPEVWKTLLKSDEESKEGCKNMLINNIKNNKSRDWIKNISAADISCFTHSTSTNPVTDDINEFCDKNAIQFYKKYQS